MSMTPVGLSDLIMEIMDAMKAADARRLDVRTMTVMADFMVIGGGGSERQVKAIADRIIEEAKKRQARPIGVEGRQQAQWILIDFGDVIAHVMHPEARQYYQLEKLWDAAAANAAAANDE